jgi:hydroxymethylbilane synthase
VKKFNLATRKSPLALAQSELVAAHIRAALRVEVELIKFITTGDRQTEWSLEKQGGKGLFTSELEVSLLNKETDLAVHSSKDLPGEVMSGLIVSGYMPREDARDVLVVRDGLKDIKQVATDSPRRRIQFSLLNPEVQFSTIRGNVDTRLRKIKDGAADATILAIAGLKRLGITSWPGLVFKPFELTEMVPAVGQAAIAIETRKEDEALFKPIFDLNTAKALSLERAIQSQLGGGCQSALGAHLKDNTLYFFHEKTGIKQMTLTTSDWNDIPSTAARILKQFGF